MSYATPPPSIRRDSHTGVPISQITRQTKVTARTGQGERKPPPSEAHNTQSTPPNPTCGGNRHFVPDPIVNHPNEIHTQGAHPHTLTKHGADDVDKDLDTESALRHALARCEPNTWTPETNKTNHQTDNLPLPRAAPIGPNT